MELLIGLILGLIIGLLFYNNERLKCLTLKDELERTIKAKDRYYNIMKLWEKSYKNRKI
jgi:hypothetical protein